MKIFTFMGIIAFALVANACGDGVKALGEVGDQCSAASDCSGSLCIEELGTDVADDPITFVDGYCSQSCEWDADTGVDTCEEGSMCLSYDTDPSDDVEPVLNCYAMGCTTDWDCRDENYTCQPVGWFDSACLPIDIQDGDASREVDSSNETKLLIPAVAVEE